MPPLLTDQTPSQAFKRRCAQTGLEFSESAAVKKDLGKAEEVMNARNFLRFSSNPSCCRNASARICLPCCIPVHDSAAAVIDSVTGAQPVCPPLH